MTRFIIVAALLANTAASQMSETLLFKWYRFIRPSKVEKEWNEISWRDEFGAAVVEAREAKKPLLLWAMNGHPLGCT